MSADFLSGPTTSCVTGSSWAACLMVNGSWPLTALKCALLLEECHHLVLSRTGECESNQVIRVLSWYIWETYKRHLHSPHELLSFCHIIQCQVSNLLLPLPNQTLISLSSMNLEKPPLYQKCHLCMSFFRLGFKMFLRQCILWTIS